MTPEAYVEIVRQRLAAAGASPSVVQLPRGPGLVGVRSQFRLTWMATKLHLLTVVVPTAYADGDGLVQFAEDALAYADAQKGAFRGLQVGVGAVPVLVAERVDPSAIEVAEHRLIRKFAKFAWPTVVDLGGAAGAGGAGGAGGVHSHQGRVAIGGIYAKWIRQQIANDLPDPATLPQ